MKLEALIRRVYDSNGKSTISVSQRHQMGASPSKKLSRSSSSSLESNLSGSFRFTPVRFWQLASVGVADEVLATAALEVLGSSSELAVLKLVGNSTFVFNYLSITAKDR